MDGSLLLEVDPTIAANPLMVFYVGILSPTLIDFSESWLLAEPPVRREGEALTEDRWLSVDQIAEYLGVVKASIYRWIELKGLPAHKAGKLWKFKRDEVDKWVRTGRVADEAASSRAPRPRKRR
jgi:excisionase family DNA binding protein